MMTSDLVMKLAGPRLHVGIATADTLENWRLSLVNALPEVAVRVLRGERMVSDSSLFDEIAAAMQFPYYFGNNWNALTDCMRDLAWMPAKAYVVVVREANLVQSSDAEGFKLFIRTMDMIAAEWAGNDALYRPWAPGRRPFQVLLHASEGGRSALEALLSSTGIPYDESYRLS